MRDWGYKLRRNARKLSDPYSPFTIDHSPFTISTSLKQLVLRLRSPVDEPLKIFQLHFRRLFLRHGVEGTFQLAEENNLEQLAFHEVNIDRIAFCLVDAGIGAVFVLQEINGFRRSLCPYRINRPLVKEALHPG